MRYPYTNTVSRPKDQTLKLHLPSGIRALQRIVSLITASMYGKRLQSFMVGKTPSPNVCESPSWAFPHTSGNIVIARKRQAMAEDTWNCLSLQRYRGQHETHCMGSDYQSTIRQTILGMIQDVTDQRIG